MWFVIALVAMVLGLFLLIAWLTTRFLEELEYGVILELEAEKLRRELIHLRNVNARWEG